MPLAPPRRSGMGMITRPNKADVAHIRQELWEVMDQYDLIRDCLCGEYAVKKQNAKYLPVPNSAVNDINSPRYQEYITRAVFYNVVERTAEGLVGQLFLREPDLKLPSLLEPIRENANGEGMTFGQMLKHACNHVLPYGRGGFLADYPTDEEPASLEKIRSGEVRPTIKFFEPWDITNWEEKTYRGEKVLTMLILRESYEQREPGTYHVQTYKQYRVLEIINGTVWVSVHTEEDNKFKRQYAYELRDANNFPFERIPFSFVGSDSNDCTIDKPPLYAMSVLNVAHYRNSADYEEMIYFMGQPTLFINGVSENWNQDVWGGNLYLGSRAVVPAPPGAQETLIQIQQNTVAKEGMDQKENQMMALGAKLVERKTNVERKEKEIEIEAASDVSTLTKIADNIESAVVHVLKFAARFVGANESEIELEVNRNFDLTSLTAEELRQLNEMNNAERPLLAREEMRRILKRSGMTSMEDSVAETKICLLYTSPSPRDRQKSRMPSSA